MIGRLIHLGTVLPQIHHFTSKLKELLQRAMNRQSVTFSEAVVDDLRLMLYFLNEAASGIDINLIAYKRSTKIYRPDSCPASLGGYSCDCFTWRFYIPRELIFRTSNNLLKHLAAAITPWIDILA